MAVTVSKMITQARKNLGKLKKSDTNHLLGGMMGMLSSDVMSFHIIMDFNIITNHCCVELGGDILLKDGNSYGIWQQMVNYYIKRKVTEYLALHYNKEWSEEYECPTLGGEAYLSFTTNNNSNVKALFLYKKNE